VKPCGGLKNACDEKTNKCECNKAYKEAGYKSTGDAFLKVCLAHPCKNVSKEFLIFFFLTFVKISNLLEHNYKYFRRIINPGNYYFFPSLVGLSGIGIPSGIIIPNPDFRSESRSRSTLFTKRIISLLLEVNLERVIINIFKRVIIFATPACRST